MTHLDDHGRPEPPGAADEAATVLGFLEYQRATLAWKTSGLDTAGLQATVGASSMTLGGMLKHLAYVEDLWFSQRLLGREPEPPWDAVDWKADRDWDWHSAAQDSPEQLRAIWQDAVVRSRAPGHDSAGGLRIGPAGHGCPQFLGIGGTESAVDRGPHDRGIRAAQWPCRPPPGMGGRCHRGIAQGRYPHQADMSARRSVTERTNRHPDANHCSRRSRNTSQACRAGHSAGSNDAGRPGSSRGNSRHASISRR